MRHFVIFLALAFFVIACDSNAKPQDNKDAGASSVFVKTTAEEPGENCPTGGIKVDMGFDKNDNNVLDETEIVKSEYVCNGIDGVDGTDGTDGTNGDDGTDGTDGTNGADGKTAMVNTTDEAAGSNCTNGGKKIESGLDDDGNDTLDTGEIDKTEYICNGINGSNGEQGEAGTNGTNGLNSLMVVTDYTGIECPNGGYKIETGVDDDGDLTLDAGEIDSTVYVCNGEDGAQGEQGVQGEIGQQGIQGETGLQGEQGIQGIQGDPGEDGCDAIVNVTDEPVGTNCATGGKKIESGEDCDGNGTIDGIATVDYVCNPPLCSEDSLRTIGCGDGNLGRQEQKCVNGEWVNYLGCTGYPEASFVVLFPDESLENCIRTAIAKPAGDILLSDVAAIDALHCEDQGIDDITGIQYLIYLKELWLGNHDADTANDNAIVDISPLGGMTALKFIDLNGNQVTDLTALWALDNLNGVYLNNLPAPIEQLDVLDRLPHIVSLALQGFTFDEAGIQHLTVMHPYLVHLELAHANITDIVIGELRFFDYLEELIVVNSSLEKPYVFAKLPNLVYLDMRGNQITELLEFTGLGGLEEIYLSNNLLPTLWSPTEGTFYFAGLGNLRILDVSHNLIGSESNEYLDYFADNNTKLESLNVSYNSYMNTDADFTALDKLKSINVSYNATIGTAWDIQLPTSIESIYARGIGIDAPKFLNQGIAPFTNLLTLDIGENAMEDISPLGSLGLDSLETLLVDGNPITALGDLTDLTDTLRTLDMSDVLTDTTMLGDIDQLNQLTTLRLRNTGISDLTLIHHLSANLTTLDVSENPDLTDLTVLGTNFLGLTGLDISDNPQINDLTAIKFLVNLEWLDFSGDTVSSLEPLDSLTTPPTMYVNADNNCLAQSEFDKWMQDLIDGGATIINDSQSNPACP